MKKVQIKVKKTGGKWRVWLISGVQSFEVGPPREEREDAKWYATMLRKALGL